MESMDLSKNESEIISNEKCVPKTPERDVWKEFHEYVHRGDVDKILELANFLYSNGREEVAEKVLKRAYEIEGMNFKEKSKEIFKQLDKKEIDEEGVDK